MNDLTIEKGNKIIDGFLEMPHEGLYEYHKEWRLLMPVVEKIESLGIVVEISNGFYLRNVHNKMFYRCKVFTYDERGEVVLYLEIYDTDLKITAVWKAIIEVIKYYNKEQKAQVSDIKTKQQ